VKRIVPFLLNTSAPSLSSLGLLYLVRLAMSSKLYCIDVTKTSELSTTSALIDFFIGLVSLSNIVSDPLQFSRASYGLRSYHR
jgi:hypothetical protein